MKEGTRSNKSRMNESGSAITSWTTFNFEEIGKVEYDFVYEEMLGQFILYIVNKMEKICASLNK
jgi:hypothetical protein